MVVIIRFIRLFFRFYCKVVIICASKGFKGLSALPGIVFNASGFG